MTSLRQKKGSMTMGARIPGKSRLFGSAAGVVLAVVLSGCPGSSSDPRPFRIAEIIPTEGPAPGGTQVVIHGQGFVNGYGVTFGGVDAVTVTFLSSLAMTAVTPPGTPGPVDVAVVAANGVEAVAPDAFTYLAPPQVLSLSPASGPTAGGTQVVITGLDFQAGMTATLGGNLLPIVSESPPTTVVATTPSGSPGAADLVVTNPDGQQAALVAAFTYVPPPTILFIAPSDGPAGGGTLVDIIGDDFQSGVPGTNVTFGGTDASGIDVVSATLIRCSTPPGPIGFADVEVTNPDGQTGMAPGAFEYTDAYTWYEILPATSPPGRDRPGLTYDPIRGVAVLFGGINIFVLDDTWEWNGVDWTERFPATSPPGRTLHALAQDTLRGVSVLFGGGAATLLGDTWEWNGTDWTERFPVTTPPARQNHAMTFDATRGVVVLFGGFDGFPLDDTWEWDGNNWSLRNPLVSPFPRLNHALTFDEARGVTVLFGGLSGPSYLGDTWEWDGVNWVQRFSNTMPPPRDAHNLAYDSGRGLTILFGGFNSLVPVGDTWEWDGVDWRAAAPGSPPRARLQHGMASDTNRGTVILFGGFDGSALLGDTWEYKP